MRKYISLLLILTVLLSLAVPALAAPQKPVITGTSPDSFGYLGGEQLQVWVEAEQPSSGQLRYHWYMSKTEDLALLEPLNDAREATYKIPEPDEPCVRWYLCQVWVEENGETSAPTGSRAIRVEFAAPTMEILSTPKKTVYTSGETLDLTGMHVRLHVGNGYLDSYDGKGLTITKDPLITLGEQKIAVRWKGAFDVFYVTVKEAAHTTHTFGEWMITAQPTCTEVGQRVRECNCGVTEKEDIPVVEHTWDDGTKTDEGTVYSCTVCKETKTEAGEESHKTPAKRPGKDNKTDKNKEDADDDKEKSNSDSIPIWALVLIGVAAMAVGGFLALILLGRKPKKRPSSKEGTV